jgi:glycosyltransferase involved in cell wall biosynthesis
MKASSEKIHLQPEVVVNARYRVHKITGVQRYAHEIVARLGSEVQLCAPKSVKGAIGHLWEQSILPAHCKGRLLWSPCGSGPIGYTNQVVTFHDLFPLDHPEWYNTAYSKWYSFMMKQLSSRAMHLIAVSHYTKSRLVQALGCDPDKITVIHNGLSESCKRVGRDQVDKARASLNIPTRRYVLSLSSLESRKNLRGILHAWSILHPKLPDDIWLILAGPKADANVYAKQALDANLPRVLFTGFVPETQLAALYSGASLFIFPSLAEGFGLPLLEAMACGLRCITSNNSSLPEVGGDAVDYIDPLNPTELANAMFSRLTEDLDPTIPYLPAITRARQFSWNDAASRTSEILGSLTASQMDAQPERNLA